MRISFVGPCRDERGAVAVFALGGGGLTAEAAALDAEAGGALSRALAISRYDADPGELLEILAPSGLAADRVLVVGLGDPAAANALTFEAIGAALVDRLECSGQEIVTVRMADLGPLPIAAHEAAAHLALGAELRAHRFDRYFTRPSRRRPSLGAVVVASPDPKAAQVTHGRLDAIARGVTFARDLYLEPGNILDPKGFADRAATLTEYGVKVEVLGEAAMRKLGFGALLGVSQGSAKEPQLVLLEYDGGRRGGGSAAARPVVLIGKGVTFDAGGLSLKTQADMETMKGDMAGAAAVAGAILALALRRARCRVVGVCVMAENMPSATAQRPGDIVTSLSGQTIEVIDTDCEGRLMLADAFTYAQERYAPEVMIDLATLTSAVIVSLGHEYAGLFCNDDALAARLAAAGATTGEPLWRFPMGSAYDRQLASPVADMKNVAGREGSSIIAAQFLKRFVRDGVAWAHLDIAGTVISGIDLPPAERGATGFGVRLLEQFVSALQEPA